MKNLSIVQIVIYVISAIAVIFAVLIFSDKIKIGGSSTQKLAGSLTMWGTLPYDSVKQAIDSVAGTYPELHINYSEKSGSSFQSDFVNVLASGTGPDLVLVTPADVVRNADKLLTIPFVSLPAATYQSTFVDQASLFMTDKGTLALPIVIDPMVMYYNRDLLAGAFATAAPKTWDDVASLNKKLTVKNDAGELETETVAMGTYSNVAHAKEILATLAFQAGNPLVKLDPATGKYMSRFSFADPATGANLATVMRFYAQFAKSGDDRYSWNDSLPNDRTQFVAGKLATYFGFASELPDIRKKNPNLNFAVAMVPQSARFPTKAVFGSMTGIAVTKISKQAALAVPAANAMASTPFITAYLATNPYAAPARKDMLSVDASDDANRDLIYKSAIISRGWLDPDPSQTSVLFKKYVDRINAGLANPEDILSAGDSLVQALLDNYQKASSAQ